MLKNLYYFTTFVSLGYFKTIHWKSICYHWNNTKMSLLMITFFFINGCLSFKARFSILLSEGSRVVTFYSSIAYKRVLRPSPFISKLMLSYDEYLLDQV